MAVQSSARSLNVASTLAEREPTKVRTPRLPNIVEPLRGGDGAPAATSNARPRASTTPGLAHTAYMAPSMAPPSMAPLMAQTARSRRGHHGGGRDVDTSGLGGMVAVGTASASQALSAR